MLLSLAGEDVDVVPLVEEVAKAKLEEARRGASVTQSVGRGSQRFHAKRNTTTFLQCGWRPLGVPNTTCLGTMFYVAHLFCKVDGHCGQTVLSVCPCSV